MGWPVCNTTLEDERINEVPIWDGHTFHELGLVLSAIFGLIAVVVSFVLIFLHATHYLRPHEQRHIIRILFMVPIYAAVSFLSYLYYRHSVYFEVIRDCYEAFAIASFFSLMCSYLADNLHDQKQYFRTITPKPWVWPMGWLQKCSGGEHGKLRTPRSGLTWFNVVWVSVFQYCFIRVAMTVVAVITQVFDRYCLESLNPAFSHVWVMVIEAIAVTIAMYCLIQFYVQIREDIQEHSPLQKIIAIKLVIFLSFWQSILISFLTSAGAIKASDKFQTPDIKVGIPSMLLCIEMAFFAVFHLFAFSWRPYVLGSKTFRNSTAADGKPTPTRYVGGFLGLSAILDAFNPWDFVKAIGRSAKWLFVGRKQRFNDTSYEASRINTNPKPIGSQTDIQQFDTTTSYKPPYHPATFPEDRETLLSAQQPIANYPPRTHQHPHDASPYRTQNSSGYFDAGDIGVAQTTHGDSSYHTPTQHHYSTYAAASYPSYPPYPSQESGVTSTTHTQQRYALRRNDDQYAPYGSKI